MNLFRFVNVYPQETTQEDIFDQEINQTNILSDLFGGISASILCYGPTGSGKTYTMQGNSENPGKFFFWKQKL